MIYRKELFPFLQLRQLLLKMGLSSYDAQIIIQAQNLWIQMGCPKELPLFYYVYYLEEERGKKKKLYALPYEENTLENFFVGLEMNGVVYLAYHLMAYRYEDIKDMKNELIEKIERRFPEVDTKPYKVVLPTKSEVTILAGAMEAQKKPNFCYSNEDLWVTPPLHLKSENKVRIQPDGKVISLKGNQNAYVALVIHPDEEHLVPLRLESHGGFADEKHYQVLHNLLEQGKE